MLPFVHRALHDCESTVVRAWPEGFGKVGSHFPDCNRVMVRNVLQHIKFEMPQWIARWRHVFSSPLTTCIVRPPNLGEIAKLARLDEINASSATRPSRA